MRRSVRLVPRGRTQRGRSRVMSEPGGLADFSDRAPVMHGDGLGRWRWVASTGPPEQRSYSDRHLDGNAVLVDGPAFQFDCRTSVPYPIARVVVDELAIEFVAHAARPEETD